MEYDNEGPWTEFHDMHSGGSQKEDFGNLFIQAPEDEAIVIFYNRFGHSPHRVTCTCCGEDYSVSEHSSLAQATAYDRNAKWDSDSHLETAGNHLWAEGRAVLAKAHGLTLQGDKFFDEAGDEVTVERYIPLEMYIEHAENVAFIPASEIKDEERHGDVPTQGYVWQD